MTADASARLTRLNAEYARALDDDRLEDWPAFFTDPCLYSITSVDNHRQGLPAGLMYADSRGMLQDRVAALREHLGDGPFMLESWEQRSLKVSVVTRGLEAPRAIEFLPDGSIFIVERAGRLRIVRNGKLDPQPVFDE